jgi:hypothetical protein
MADETTPTPTSDPTPTNPAATEPPAADKAPDAGADKDVDLGTALGGDDKAPEPKPDAEPKADEGGDAEPPKAAVPEAYELTPPEGFDKLDEKAVAAATPVFKELGLSNEQAQKLIPVAGEFAKSIVEQRDQQLLGTVMEQRASWLEDARKDPEIGGQNWDKSLQDAARFMDHMGFPKGSPLRGFLNDSGAGNHPELIRLFAKAGKLIAEDGVVRGDADVAVKPKTDAELFYGTPSKE